MDYEKYIKGEDILEFEHMLSILSQHEKELEKEKDPQKAQLWLLVFYLYKKVNELENKIKEMESSREFLRSIVEAKDIEDLKKSLEKY